MSAQHHGYFSSNEVYTRKTIAEKLNKSEEWVMANMLRCGLPCWVQGRTYVVTGQSLLLWFEAHARPLESEDVQ